MDVDITHRHLVGNHMKLERTKIKMLEINEIVLYIKGEVYCKYSSHPVLPVSVHAIAVEAIFVLL